MTLLMMLLRDCVLKTSFGKTITLIDGNTIIPASGNVVVTNSTADSILRLRLYQGDSAIAAKNAYIGTLEYDYGRVMEVDSGIVKVTANVTRDGIIKLAAEQLLLGCCIISGNTAAKQVGI